MNSAAFSHAALLTVTNIAARVDPGFPFAAGTISISAKGKPRIERRRRKEMCESYAA
jgi:hypothetical protein